MTDLLLAYLLDDLSAERRADVDRQLAVDPALRLQLQRLEECLASCGDTARCADEPPPDLVRRTCKAVEDSGEMPSAKTLAAALTPVASSGRRSRWSMADYMVCGGVLAVLGMLVVPAMVESRETTRRLACQDNLRAYASAMSRFALSHGNRTPPVRPGQSAGLIPVRLAAASGAAPEQFAAILWCPATAAAADADARCRKCSRRTLVNLDSAQREIVDELIHLIGGNLAYAIGSRDVAGRYQDPLFTGDQYVPLAADAPTWLGGVARSNNHTTGHNIVFQDMHVTFVADCQPTCGNQTSSSAEHFFVNDEGEQAAGCHRGDAVLVDIFHGPSGSVRIMGVRP